MVVVNLMLNRQCNLGCTHCHVDSLPASDPAPVMSIENVEYILKTVMVAEDVELVHLFGGEPFLHPHLEDICNVIHDARVPVNVATNGTLVEPHLPWLHRTGVSLSINMLGDDPRLVDMLGFQFPLQDISHNARHAVHAGLDVNGIVCVFPVRSSAIEIARFYKDYMDRLHENTGIKDFFLLYFSRLGRGVHAWNNPVMNKDFFRADNWLLFLQVLQSKLAKDEPPYSVFIEPAFDTEIISMLPPVYLQCEMIVKENMVITPDMNVHLCLLMASVDDPAYHRPFDGKIARLQAWLQDLPLSGVPRETGTCRTCSERGYCGPCTPYIQDRARDYRCKGNTGKETLMGCPLATVRLW